MRPNAPEAARWYRVILLTHTAIIAFAGIVANYKLLRVLENFAGSRSGAWRVLLAWLAGNLFVGAQLSYNLRPFFGNPELPVQFVRPDPFDGSFYEAVWRLLLASLPRGDSAMLAALQVLLAVTLLALFFYLQYRAVGPVKNPTDTTP